MRQLCKVPNMWQRLNKCYSPVSVSTQCQNLVECLYEGTETIITISHYSLHLVLGNIENQAVHGTNQLSLFHKNIVFNKLPVFPCLQSSDIELLATCRLRERQKDILSLSGRCLCQFPRAVILKYYKCGLKQQKLVLSQFQSP